MFRDLEIRLEILRDFEIFLESQSVALNFSKLDNPIRANRFADSGEWRESREGSRIEPPLLRIAFRCTSNCK